MILDPYVALWSESEENQLNRRHDKQYREFDSLYLKDTTLVVEEAVSFV